MGNCLSSSALSVEEGVKVFTVAELKKATKNFGKDMVTGESFGKVVKGYINPKTLAPAKEGVGMAVTVKRVYLTNKQALQEWLVDLEFLRLNFHPSLVKLFGYGSDLGMPHMAGDVYSFGIILLETLTGFGKQRIILAIRNDKDNIVEMIDPDLENSYPLEAGRHMCELIEQCLEEDPKIRPSMQQVLDNLNAIAQI